MPGASIPAPSAQGWTRPLIWLVGGLALYQAAYVAAYLVKDHGAAAGLYGDFFAFWSFARFAHGLPAERIYDTAALQAFQQSLPGGFDGFYPYPYPPLFLLFLWPLGWLGFGAAYGAWTAVGLGAYVAAMAGRDWRAPRLWLALAAPTTLLAVLSGQNGLLAAALIIGGLRLLPRRPLVGGALLGALAFKPQLFILLPIVLLAGRQWRGLLGMASCVLALTGLSVAVFGLGAWSHWLRAIPTLTGLFERNRAALGSLMPTVTADLLRLGAPRLMADGVQAAAALGVIACLWILFSRASARAAPRPREAGVLMTGVFLATPYAFIYDLPMVSSAVAEALTEPAGKGERRLGERIVLHLALVLPVVMLGGALKGWPIGSVTLIALMVVMVRRAWRQA